MRLAYALQLLYSAGINTVFRIFPAYLKSFVASAFLISLVPAAYNLAKAFALPLGSASDRLGHRQAVSLGFLATAALVTVLSFASGILEYIALFFLIGLASMFFYNSLNALVSETERKTETFFRMEVVYLIGLLIGPPLGGFLAAQHSMTLAIQLWALLSFAGFLLSLRIHPRPSVRQARAASGLRAALDGQRSRFLLFLLHGGFLSGFFVAAADLAIPLYALSLGYSLAEVGIIFGGLAAISALSLFAISSRIERAPPAAALLLSTLLAAGSLFAMLFFTDLLSLVLLAGCFSIGRTAGLNLGRAFIVRAIPAGRRAAGLGLLETVSQAGRIAGPLLAGALIDLFSVAAVFWLLLLMAVAGVLCSTPLIGRRTA